MRKVTQPFSIERHPTHDARCHRSANGQVIELSECRFGQRGVFITVTRNFGQQVKLRPKQQEPDQPTATPGVP
jgi:hypothetical protein